jgi:hypothetical protein
VALPLQLLLLGAATTRLRLLVRVRPHLLLLLLCAL